MKIVNRSVFRFISRFFQFITPFFSFHFFQKFPNSQKYLNRADRLSLAGRECRYDLTLGRRLYLNDTAGRGPGPCRRGGAIMTPRR
jgi:hypothetical protein